MTDHFFTACIARLAIGFGSAFAAVGTMKLAANWFPPQKFALLTGMMVTIGMLGAIGGEAPLALLIDHYGWRHSMIIMGVFGLIIAFLIFIIANDTPKSRQEAYNEYLHDEPLLSSLLELVKNNQLWLVAIYGGLMYMSTPVFCGLWGVPFLMFKMNLTKAMAANFISLVFVGWAIASPLWGIYSNLAGRRKPSLLIGCVGAFTTSVLFIYCPIQSKLLMQMLLLLFGIFSAGFLPAFALAKELCNKKYVATSLSFMNMMNMIGIALAQPAIGFILDHMWRGEIVNKVRVYPMDAYLTALSLLPASILVSLLILPFIKETYCKNIHQ
jgi:MFS family permease